MISIFIPVYNGEHYLSKTLDSVLGQTYSDWELLCVDDSSTDGSMGILNCYAEKEPRIRVFHKANGGSVPPSWNFIIPHIKGDFTLYMSQDDLLESNTLELLVNRQVETDSDAVIPHEIHYFSNQPSEKLHHLKGIKGDTSQVVSGKDAFRLMIDYSISGRALWPTSVIKRIGMPTDTFNSDELAQRLWALECGRIAFSDAVFLYCRDNPGSITQRCSPLHFESVLTNALLFQHAGQALSGETALLGEMANNYFYDLYLRMLQYAQKRRNYPSAQRKRIKQCFYSAYLILHDFESLSNWKFRFSKICYPLMWLVIIFKKIQYAFRGIDIMLDMDLKPIRTPRKYLQNND